MVRDHLRPIEIARIVGVTPAMVRYYSWLGFLPPSERSKGGHHLYTQQHVQAAKASHALIQVFGWQKALPVMQLIHRGALDEALALIDARHAEIVRERRKIDAALSAMHTLLESMPASSGRPRQRKLLRVGEAARTIGVRPTTLHYWEHLGLLSPTRDESSGYRMYDAEQMRRIQVISILRKGGYEHDDIRPVMDELASGTPEKALSAMEERKLELAEQSRLCARATARVWDYVEQSCPSLITPLVADPPRYWRIRSKR